MEEKESTRNFLVKIKEGFDLFDSLIGRKVGNILKRELALEIIEVFLQKNLINIIGNFKGDILLMLNC